MSNAAGSRADVSPGVDSIQIEAKAKELLSRLTQREKNSMMYGDWPFWRGMVDLMDNGVAAHSWNAGALPRHCLPGIKFVDGPRGIILKGATTFPVAMARGAAWDIDLEERVGDAIGVELRALGGNLFGGVCINLLRHPAWGRAQETYGEDPHHLGELGAALTRGVQRHAMACAKHFALNSMENARFEVDVKIGNRALHEIYLPHFKRVVDEGVAAIMSAYNSVNNEWCGQNQILLSEIIKERWGFDGFVMTDFIFGIRAAGKAVLAGQDLEMPFQMLFHKDLKRLVRRKKVPVERLNDATFRLLKQQLRFIRHAEYGTDLIGCKKHRALAREVAEKSIVLLKNENNTLPFLNIKRLAVIGRLAAEANTGDGGSSKTQPDYVVTPLEGIIDSLEGDAEVQYDDGSDLERARTIAQRAEAAIVVVGYTHEDEGEYITGELTAELMALLPKPALTEIPTALRIKKKSSQSRWRAIGGDRDSLTLNPKDEALVQAISEVNRPTVVAVMGGSAVIMESWRHRVPAILMLWYPGMEGGSALANILFGRRNPTGKLPFIIPKSTHDLPFFDRDASAIEYDLWHGYRKLDRDNVEPAFPFGFGLSYATYAYSNLELDATDVPATGSLQLSLDVSNRGEYAGEEIVQLYISAIGSRVERASKELKCFARVALNPHETRRIVMSTPVKSFAYFDETQMDFVVELIDYEVVVGAHSLDKQALRAKFRVM